MLLLRLLEIGHIGTIVRINNALVEGGEVKESVAVAGAAAAYILDL